METIDRATLVQLYEIEKKSIPDVGMALGVSYSAARRHLLKEGIALRSRADGIRAAVAKLGKHMIGKTRIFTPEWKENIRSARLAHGEAHANGVSHKKGGYSEFTRGPHKGRNVHDVLMEAHIGRPLNQDEIVHHVDEDKQHNEITNLRLLTRSAHSKLHGSQRNKGERNGKR